MKIWTFQSTEVYQKLLEQDIYYCNIDKSELCQEFKSFKTAYNWMRTQMYKRLSGINTNTWPIWCWYKWNNKHKKPDLRYAEFKYREADEYLIELEVPDDQVLLSDFDNWHFVLNGIDNEDWQEIFNVDESVYIQACIPEIKSSWILSCKYCPAHPET